MESNKANELVKNYRDEVLYLLSDRNYLFILFGFTMALGNLNALAALINQLPGDYSNANAGTLGLSCLNSFIIYELNNFSSKELH
jgi:hypothetical protein